MKSKGFSTYCNARFGWLIGALDAMVWIAVAYFLFMPARPLASIIVANLAAAIVNIIGATSTIVTGWPTSRVTLDPDPQWLREIDRGVIGWCGTAVVGAIAFILIRTAP